MESLLLRMIAAQLEEVASHLVYDTRVTGLLDDAFTKIRKAAEIIE
jgi:predicted membrane-bound spermidine synthase